jgi:cobalt/nickel transport protein
VRSTLMGPILVLKLTAPNEYFVTLKLKTDKNGGFAFSPPKAGWWGFSALNEEKEAIRGPDGKKKTAEYGAVLWAEFTDWLAAK